MEITYRQLNVECACGAHPEKFSIGVSNDGNLVAFWDCSECEEQMVWYISLQVLIENLPVKEDQKLLAPPSFTAEDTKYLKEMHVCLGE